MIEIRDIDLPITVAEKLITGTRKSILGFSSDQFDKYELEEIANYLLVYVKSMRVGDTDA